MPSPAAAHREVRRGGFTTPNYGKVPRPEPGKYPPSGINWQTTKQHTLRVLHPITSSTVRNRLKLKRPIQESKFNNVRGSTTTPHCPLSLKQPQKHLLSFTPGRPASKSIQHMVRTILPTHSSRPVRFILLPILVCRCEKAPNLTL